MKWSCRCNLRSTPLSCWRVMHLLTMLSHILFNQWLRKWSCRCNLRLIPLFSWRVTSLPKWSSRHNIRLIPLFFWGVMRLSTMYLAFPVQCLLNKGEFHSLRVCSLQVLVWFPLIGMILRSLTFLLLHLSR
jgi:hypothetical protein